MQPLESEQKRAERIERIEHEKKGKIFFPDELCYNFLIQNWKHSKKSYV